MDGFAGALNGWLDLLARPGLLLQRLTTREPDDAQVEVAIAAMKGALSLDGETA